MYLIEVPVEGGGRLVVQVSAAELPGDLELAGVRPGEVVARARQSLEQALDQIKPALRAVLNRLVAMSPDEISVEFGLTLGVETGVVVAKGTRSPPGVSGWCTNRDLLRPVVAHPLIHVSPGCYFRRHQLSGEAL